MLACGTSFGDSVAMAEKRKKCELTVEVERKIIKCVEDNSINKKLDIGKELKTPPSTFATILKNNEKFEEDNKLSSISKRAKSSELKNIEECVLKWLIQC